MKKFLLMVGAMIIQGIQPGLQVMTERPQLFWGMIASMWVGNLMLVVLNLPLIGMWIKLLQVPYRILYPAILLFCAIGVYSINNTSVDILLTVLFVAPMALRLLPTNLSSFVVEAHCMGGLPPYTDSLERLCKEGLRLLIN
jgi:TctA family transporter